MNTDGKSAVKSAPAKKAKKEIRKKTSEYSTIQALINCGFDRVNCIFRIPIIHFHI